MQFLGEPALFALAVLQQLAFKLAAARDVAHEPARVDHPPPFPKTVGVQQHMTNRAPGGAELGGKMVDCFAAREPVQQVFERGGVGMDRIARVVQDFRRRTFQERAEGLVRPLHDPAGRDEHASDRGVVEQVVRFQLPAGQRVAQALLLADVARDGGKPDEAVKGITAGRKRERDWKAPAVLAHPLGLEMCHDLAAAQAGDELPKFVETLAEPQGNTVEISGRKNSPVPVAGAARQVVRGAAVVAVAWIMARLREGKYCRGIHRWLWYL